MISRWRNTWWKGKSLPKRTTCFPFASATRKLSLLKPPFSGSIEIVPFHMGSARMRSSAALTSLPWRLNLGVPLSNAKSPLNCAIASAARSAGSRMGCNVERAPRRCQRGFCGFFCSCARLSVTVNATPGRDMRKAGRNLPRFGWSIVSISVTISGRISIKRYRKPSARKGEDRPGSMGCDRANELFQAARRDPEAASGRRHDHHRPPGRKARASPWRPCGAT